MKKFITAIIFVFFNSNAFPDSNANENQNEEVIFERQIEEAKALSSGADIVGNGAGRIELLANFYLRQLDQTISFCLSSTSCQLTKADRFVLKEIRNISIESRGVNKKLIFLKENDFNRIFNSQNIEEVKIAKTGFNKRFPIFFNLGELYSFNKDSIDRILIAILIHELGHQTGIHSHSYLDELASRVSLQFNQTLNKLSLNYKDNFFELTVFTNRGTYDFAKAYFSMNEEVIEVKYLDSALKCSDPNSKIVGISLTNTHWNKVKLEPEAVLIEIGLWAQVYCEDISAKTSHFELYSMNWNLFFEIVKNSDFEKKYALKENIISVDRQ
jgi:hypothetical protein